MSISSTVCRLLLMFLVVNCLQQVRCGEDNDRAAFLALASADPCNKAEVKAGDRESVAVAADECGIAFRLFQMLPFSDQANCRNAAAPECAFTRGERGYPRCTFDCDYLCTVKSSERQGSGRKAKLVTVTKVETTRKRLEISYISERVKKPPRGTHPTRLTGGAGGGGGAGTSGAGPSGAGGSGYGGGSAPGSGDGRRGYGGSVAPGSRHWLGNTGFTEGRWSTS